MLDVIIFGTGGAWNRIKEYWDEDKARVIYFLDNKPNAEAILFRGENIPACRPADFFVNDRGRVAYDAIMIASTYYAEILEQLVGQYGIDPRKVCHIYEDNKLLRSLLKNSYFWIKTESDRMSSFRWFAKQGQSAIMHLVAKQNIIMNNSRKDILSIRDVEFKVYSQWGEDGIIQWLIHILPIKNKTFIEFGVQSYVEANTRFLLEENNWSGMIMDGSTCDMEAIRKSELYWRYDLYAKDVFITKANINDLLLESGFDEDLGLLSVDIDGNDYWVLKEISVMRPRILICEYNALYGEDCAVTTLYRDDFVRTKAHYSNLHFGASLKAIRMLAEEKGYHFIGVNSNACNAFFVRNDLISYLPRTVLNDHEFVDYKFRQARDESGNLTFLSHKEERELIRDMEVWDIEEQKTKKVSEL